VDSAQAWPWPVRLAAIVNLGLAPLAVFVAALAFVMANLVTCVDPRMYLVAQHAMICWAVSTALLWFAVRALALPPGSQSWLRARAFPYAAAGCAIGCIPGARELAAQVPAGGLSLEGAVATGVFVGLPAAGLLLNLAAWACDRPAVSASPQPPPPSSLPPSPPPSPPPPRP